MEEPKKLWIGANWKAERDHYGLDKRCGMFSTERFNEDDKGYVTADLTDALVEAAEAYFDKYGVPSSKEGWAMIEALAALKAMKG